MELLFVCQAWGYLHPLCIVDCQHYSLSYKLICKRKKINWKIEREITSQEERGFWRNVLLFSTSFFFLRGCSSHISSTTKNVPHINQQTLQNICRWRFRCNLLLSSSQSPQSHSKQRATPCNSDANGLCTTLLHVDWHEPAFQQRESPFNFERVRRDWQMSKRGLRAGGKV